MSIVLDLWLQAKRDDALFGDVVRERVGRLIDAFEAVLRDGEQRGELIPMDIPSMAYTLFSILESFSIHAPFAESFDLDAYMASLRILYNGLER
jgi:hypothetical protein